MTAFSDMPQLIAGRYKPIAEIGRGGMGSVILVEHVNTGDRLALKFLHRSFGENADIVERFKREARAAAKIKSDHVVRITDADISPELEGLPFMVMEVLDGQDLKKRLASVRQLTKEDVVGILSQVARALDRAHAIGIIHRDIKPENIFLHRKEDGTEIVKLLDFGISKMLGDIDSTSTQTGMVLGTPYFMAPEQIRNAPVSAQTDVWAIGMVAFKLLTGVNYWPSASMGELMAMVLSHPMEPPTAQDRGRPLGPAFDAWFFRSCDRDPARRWRSVGEQVSALADAFGMPLPQTISGASGPFVPPAHGHSHPATQPATHPAQPSHAPFPSGSMPYAANAASGPSVAGVTGGTAPQPKSSPVAAYAILGLCILCLVGVGSWRFARARLAGTTPATTTSTATSNSPPPETALVPTPTATPALTATQDTTASAAPIASQAPTATPSAAASVVTAASAAPASTHVHAAASSTRKPAAAASQKGEDPWAR